MIILNKKHKGVNSQKLIVNISNWLEKENFDKSDKTVYLQSFDFDLSETFRSFLGGDRECLDLEDLEWEDPEELESESESLSEPLELEEPEEL